jgi:hypothetical protein
MLLSNVFIDLPSITRCEANVEVNDGSSTYVKNYPIAVPT